MRHRSFAPLNALGIALVVVAPVVVSGQAPSAGAKATTPATKAWTPPRTPDGQPDLQGIWLSHDATPLERPKALEGKQFLTDEEVTDLKKRAARLFEGGVNSDFAGGDNFFLATLANPDVYKNRNSTGSFLEMVDRAFDNRTSLIADPPDGKIPLMTEEGRQRRLAADASAFLAPRSGPPGGPEDLSAFIRCITFGAPRLGGAAASYNSYYQIVQPPGYVLLFSEVIHDARIVPLDGRPHPSQSIRNWHGDSRGRWEGSTLVVDTTNFSPKSSLLGSAENLHVVERFTRVAPDRINYEMTLADPTTWTKPWTAVVHLEQTNNNIYEYACHEGNQQIMTDILAGARAEEKAAEEAAKRR